MENKSSKVNSVVFWFALGLLFFLRLPLSWIGNAIPSAREWTDPVYEIGTYVLIIFLVWWERENLEIHHMDGFAIFIIILFKPISTVILKVWNPDSVLAFPKPLSIIISLASLVLLIFILRKQIHIKVDMKQSIIWMVASSLIGIVFFVSAGIIMIKFLGYPLGAMADKSMWLSPVYQIGHAAAVEEPFFRGFLWGGLKKVGIKDIWILFIQAFLFMLGHLHLLQTPQVVFNLGFIFVAALLMGLVVWKSRKLSASMMFHGFGNGSAIIQYYVQTLLFR